jgi:lysophospholipase L1-like esterase
MRRLFALALLALLACATDLLVGPSRFEEELRHFAAIDRRDPPAPGAVLFVGSSSIKLWQDIEADFPGVRVLKRGLGSAGIADLTRFAGRLVIPYQPRRIVFYAGDNDLAYGRSPQQVLADFEDFVALVQRDLPATEIAFVSIKPRLARADLLPKVQDANARIRRFIARQPGLSYIDVHTPMLDAKGRPRRELYRHDGIHLNREGYRLWAEVIGPTLR